MTSNRNQILSIATCLFTLLTLVNDGLAAEKLKPISTQDGKGEMIEEVDDSTKAKLIEAVDALKALSENRPIDGVTAVALLLMGSLIVDRIASGLIALLSLARFWESSFPDPATISSDQRRARTLAKTKLVVVYYLFAILAAAGLILIFRNVHIWQALGFPQLTDQEDRIITALVMVVGAERLAHWFQLPGAPGGTQSSPVEVSGSLVLTEPVQTESK